MLEQRSEEIEAGDALNIANKLPPIKNNVGEESAAGLAIANKELLSLTQEKEKRAAELVIANRELIFQNEEKEKRAAELAIANRELIFQNEEKEKRAAELAIANRELVFQNEEKEKRAAELAIANRELIFQNEEKEKRAVELAIAVTELEKAQHIIAELNISLEHRIAERTIQLEQANKELESFSYSVSHDLRAPLRGINGFTRILTEDYMEQLDDEAKGILSEIIESSNKMGQLIDNLLEFSRIGKQNISMGNINIDEMVASVIKELKQQEPAKKLALTVKKLGNIKGDRNMLRQVFVNLISNAFKYTGKKENAVIEIGSYVENEARVYYVKDNGAGFDMHYYDKLFGVFQRLHSSNEFEGTGVGLAIVQRIIVKHGGKVWAEGKVDGGACFYISLPHQLNKSI